MYLVAYGIYTMPCTTVKTVVKASSQNYFGNNETLNHLLGFKTESLCAGFLFLMHGHIFQHISIKFGMWHPHTPKMVTGAKIGAPRE